MITQNGYQGPLVSVVGASEFSQYAAGKGPQPWPLNYRTQIVGWWRRESVVGPYGTRDAWPSAFENGPMATQPTSAKRPFYKSGNANNEGTVVFTPGDTAYMSLPSAFYSKLSGPPSYTVLCRVRVRAWSNGNIYSLTTSDGFSQHYATANPSFGIVTPRGFVSSAQTDLSQTTRYVAFTYDRTALKVNVIERGKRISAAATVGAEVPSAAFIGAFALENNLYDGEIDELIVLSAALSDAEIQASLPYLYRDRYMSTLCFGNSIFEGYAGQTPFLCQLEDALPSGYGVSAAFCRGSITTANLLTEARERAAGQIIPGATRALFWEETNSIASGISFNDLKAQCAQVRDYFFGLGIDVVRATVLPRAAFNASQNAVRTAWNNELKQRPLLYASRADMVIKWDEDPRLQNPNNAAVYFDGTHPTTLGASYMVENAIPLLLSL